MFSYNLELLRIDLETKLREQQRFRVGEPSGMLVAIAWCARAIERSAGAIERWARRPARSEFLPRIPAR
jgi:hypothetical protein